MKCTTSYMIIGSDSVLRIFITFLAELEPVDSPQRSGASESQQRTTTFPYMVICRFCRDVTEGSTSVERRGPRRCVGWLVVLPHPWPGACADQTGAC